METYMQAQRGIIPKYSISPGQWFARGVKCADWAKFELVKLS